MAASDAVQVPSDDQSAPRWRALRGRPCAPCPRKLRLQGDTIRGEGTLLAVGGPAHLLRSSDISGPELRAPHRGLTENSAEGLPSTTRGGCESASSLRVAYGGTSVDSVLAQGPGRSGVAGPRSSRLRPEGAQGCTALHGTGVSDSAAASGPGRGRFRRRSRHAESGRRPRSSSNGTEVIQGSEQKCGSVSIFKAQLWLPCGEASGGGKFG